MKKTIWKYTLKPIVFLQEIEVPNGAEFLTVQNQHDELYIWALVNPEMKKEKRTICIIDTGQPINNDENLQYIGTTQMRNGNVIRHVFEYIE